MSTFCLTRPCVPCLYILLNLGYGDVHFTLVVSILVHLDEEFDTVREQFVLSSPDGFIEELLEERAIEVAISHHRALDYGPETLNAVRCLVLRRTTSLLSLVHDSMRVEVLQAVVAAPEICVDLSSHFNIL